jgi:hypothetical protein
LYFPDHSTIWRFRQLLNTENLLEPLLEQINHHLEQNSIIVSLGSINIIDATVARGVSHLFNKIIFIGVDMHFIAIGGFSFTISGYFDIIVGFRISKFYTGLTEIHH